MCRQDGGGGIGIDQCPSHLAEVLAAASAQAGADRVGCISEHSVQQMLGSDLCSSLAVGVVRRQGEGSFRGQRLPGQRGAAAAAATPPWAVAGSADCPAEGVGSEGGGELVCDMVDIDPDRVQVCGLVVAQLGNVPFGCQAE